MTHHDRSPDRHTPPRQRYGLSGPGQEEEVEEEELAGRRRGGVLSRRLAARAKDPRNETRRAPSAVRTAKRLSWKKKDYFPAGGEGENQQRQDFGFTSYRRARLLVMVLSCLSVK